MLSSLLYNVSFAALLIFALEGFRGDEDILADLDLPHEDPSRVGPETAPECVWHVS